MWIFPIFPGIDFWAGRPQTRLNRLKARLISDGGKFVKKIAKKKLEKILPDLTPTSSTQSKANYHMKTQKIETQYYFYKISIEIHI